MKTIKLTKAFPGYLEGQVLEVDENSAAALIDRGDAIKYEPPQPTPNTDDQAGETPPATDRDAAPNTDDQASAEPAKPGRPKASTRG